MGIVINRYQIPKYPAQITAVDVIRNRFTTEDGRKNDGRRIRIRIIKRERKMPRPRDIGG